jgi:hypothetical protein
MYAIMRIYDCSVRNNLQDFVFAKPSKFSRRTPYRLGIPPSNPILTLRISCKKRTPRKVEITPLSKFLDFATEIYCPENPDRCIFRGHTDETYKVMPSVTHSARIAGASVIKYGKNLSNIFCTEAGIYIPTPQTNEWDWLSLAQHHGLPVSPFAFETVAGVVTLV